MKKQFKFALLILCLGLFSCSYPYKQEKYYVDDDCKIIAMGNQCSLTEDKFRTPQLCNFILVQRVDDTTLYMQLNTCNLPDYVKIDAKWLYEHNPGDIIHFDYIKKERFFTIDKK